MEVKLCSKCKNTFSINEFFKDKTHSDGLQSRCKRCKTEADKIYYKKNRKKISKHEKEYYIKNRKYILNRVKQYRIDNKDKIRNYWKTKKGREIKSKKDSKYYRSLGWNKLFDNPFPDNIEIHWHHINNLFVIPLPKKIHEKCYHWDRDEHRERANVWSYYLYGIDFDLLLGGRA